jgi:hypothetical protein
MWVSGVLTLWGASAVLFAVLRTAAGARGLASTRLIPPHGVIHHAEEVRARLRIHYLAQALSHGQQLRSGDSAWFSLEDEPDREAEGLTPGQQVQPIEVLIAERAAMSITKLPPLNESLRRGLAARGPAARGPVAPSSRPARRRRAARRSRTHPRTTAAA